MIIPITEEFDVDGFVHCVNDLAKISGRDFKTALISQVAALLKFCIRHAVSANRGRIIKKFESRADRFQFPDGTIISKSKRSGHEGHISFLDVSTFKGKTGGPKIIVGGKTWHDMTNLHWSDERWSRYQALLAQAESGAVVAQDLKGIKRAKDVKVALASVGLTKHSWLQCAEALGVAAEVAAPNWVRNARPQNGKTYQNGFALQMLDAAAAFIEVKNTHPIAIKMNGQTLINYAIKSRVKAFEREVELKVFENEKVRAERYPGVFVTNS